MTQPSVVQPEPSTQQEALLEVRNVRMHFPVTAGVVFQRQVGEVKAVDDVSFTVKRGETLGLVGESGSGKTTIGRVILQIYRPTSGQVIFDGVDLAGVSGKAMRAMRRRMQVVFQDPYSSLNPRIKTGDIVGEPIKVHKLVDNQDEYNARVAELFRTVGLNPNMADRYPHEFSGGQRQRIGVARALAVQPDFIVADEPVSALDVSIQAQLINLLEDLQKEFGLTYLFIAHDLSVVRHISDRVAVMYLGKIMELADRVSLFEEPLHPYSKALMSAVPIPNPRAERSRERIILEGSIPSPLNPPTGCVFHTRCPIATDECKVTVPKLEEKRPGHAVACLKV
jgi:oligopeptide transport system ATP-binding protein